MLNLAEINEEIKSLEECECTTYSVCSKLATLYIVRDHYKGAATREIPTETKTAAPAKGI